MLVTDLTGSTPQNFVGGINYGAIGYPGVSEGLHYEDTPPPPRLCNDLLADGPHWTQDSARYWTQDTVLYLTDKYGAGLLYHHVCRPARGRRDRFHARLDGDRAASST